MKIYRAYNKEKNIFVYATIQDIWKDGFKALADLQAVPSIWDDEDIIYYAKLSFMFNAEWEEPLQLTDKKGMIVYEGDILKRASYANDFILVKRKTEIVKECYGMGDYGEGFQSGFNVSSFGNLKDLEIVGNKYQNPELLLKVRNL